MPMDNDDLEGLLDAQLTDVRQAINLAPLTRAKDQWQRIARLALDVSRSDSIFLHRESVRIAAAAIDRIGSLVEEAARQAGG